MGKTSKKAYGKDNSKMLSIGNTFLTKRDVSTHERIKRVSLSMRHSNIDVVYVLLV